MHKSLSRAVNVRSIVGMDEDLIIVQPCSQSWNVIFAEGIIAIAALNVFSSEDVSKPVHLLSSLRSQDGLMICEVWRPFTTSDESNNTVDVMIQSMCASPHQPSRDSRQCGESLEGTGRHGEGQD